MPPRNSIKAGTAVFISLSLLWTSGEWADATLALRETSQSAAKSSLDLVLPDRMGQVTDRYQAPAKNSQFVILIQDVHANYGVQKNIAQLLEFLSEKLRSGLLAGGSDVKALGPRSPEPRASVPFAVAVEGAQGPIDSSVMSLFPDQKIKQEALDYLMREGELTGMEYFAAMRGFPNLLYGVEDERLYNTHRDLFRQTLEKRQRLVEMLRGIQADIIALKPVIYSRELQAFQSKLDAFDHGDLETREFIAFLAGQARPLGIDVSSLRTIPADKPDQLVDAMESIAFIIKVQLAKKPAESDLIQVEHDLGLLLKVADLQATEPQARSFAPRINQFVALCRSLLKSHGLKDLDEANIRDLISTSVDYYVMALMRNRPLVENTLSLLSPSPQTPEADDGRGWNRTRSQTAGVRVAVAPVSATRPAGSSHSGPHVAVLVAGGFHTAPITQLLREKYVSYIVVTPSVESLTEADHELYVKRLDGQVLSDEEILAAAQGLSPHSVMIAGRTGSIQKAGIAVGLFPVAIRHFAEYVLPAYAKREKSIGFIEAKNLILKAYRLALSRLRAGTSWNEAIKSIDDVYINAIQQLPRVNFQDSAREAGNSKSIPPTHFPIEEARLIHLPEGEGQLWRYQDVELIERIPAKGNKFSIDVNGDIGNYISDNFAEGNEFHYFGPILFIHGWTKDGQLWIGGRPAKEVINELAQQNGLRKLLLVACNPFAGDLGPTNIPVIYSRALIRNTRSFFIAEGRWATNNGKPVVDIAKGASRLEEMVTLWERWHQPLPLSVPDDAPKPAANKSSGQTPASPLTHPITWSLGNQWADRERLRLEQLGRTDSVAYRRLGERGSEQRKIWIQEHYAVKPNAEGWLFAVRIVGKLFAWLHFGTDPIEMLKGAAGITAAMWKTYQKERSKGRTVKLALARAWAANQRAHRAYNRRHRNDGAALTINPTSLPNATKLYQELIDKMDLLNTEHRWNVSRQLLESISQAANGIEKSELSEIEKQGRLENLRKQLDLQQKLLTSNLSSITDAQSATLKLELANMFASFEWGSDNAWDQTELWFDWVRGGIRRDSRADIVIQRAFMKAYQDSLHIKLPDNVVADYLIFKLVHSTLKEFGSAGIILHLHKLSYPLSFEVRDLATTGGQADIKNARVYIDRRGMSDDILIKDTLREEIIHILARAVLTDDDWKKICDIWGFTIFIDKKGVSYPITNNTRFQNLEPYWVRRTGAQTAIYGTERNAPNSIGLFRFHLGRELKYIPIKGDRVYSGYSGDYRAAPTDGTMNSIHESPDEVVAKIAKEYVRLRNVEDTVSVVSSQYEDVDAQSIEKILEIILPRLFSVNPTQAPIPADTLRKPPTDRGRGGAFHLASEAFFGSKLQFLSTLQGATKGEVNLEGFATVEAQIHNLVAEGRMAGLADFNDVAEVRVIRGSRRIPGDTREPSDRSVLKRGQLGHWYQDIDANGNRVITIVISDRLDSTTMNWVGMHELYHALLSPQMEAKRAHSWLAKLGWFGKILFDLFVEERTVVRYSATTRKTIQAMTLASVTEGAAATRAERRSARLRGSLQLLAPETHALLIKHFKNKDTVKEAASLRAFLTAA